MKKQVFDLKGIRAAVKTIKTAILKSRYMAARKANFEHLKLYFYVGAYVSANSRNGTWGTGAIAAISERLSLELPGLRGFSPSNIKNMRQFFEEWRDQSNRQLATGDLMKSLSWSWRSAGIRCRLASRPTAHRRTCRPPTRPSSRCWMDRGNFSPK